MDIVEKISELDNPMSDTVIEEAKFGYDHVKRYCENLEPGSNVLEIGCGSGILLSMLSEEFADLKMEGVEPLSHGTAAHAEHFQVAVESGVPIHAVGYEDFFPDKKYELVFCVNVFEHLEDWQDFLVWASGVIAEHGKLVILCPNYSFPYESHFMVPIVGNKERTYKVFRNRIDQLERNTNRVGLWRSLNFIKKPQVYKFLDKTRRDLNLEIHDDVTITDDMISRITTDPEFRKRQRFIGTVAVFLRRIGVVKLVQLFPRFLPYMKLEIVKRADA